MVESPYSVIIPCKDGAKTVAATLHSLVNQSLKPKQIVVIDDASTDETPKILKQFDIHTLRLDHNYPRNFNRARARS